MQHGTSHCVYWESSAWILEHKRCKELFSASSASGNATTLIFIKSSDHFPWFFSWLVRKRHIQALLMAAVRVEEDRLRLNKDEAVEKLRKGSFKGYSSLRSIVTTFLGFCSWKQVLPKSCWFSVAGLVQSILPRWTLRHAIGEDSPWQKGLAFLKSIFPIEDRKKRSEECIFGL